MRDINFLILNCNNFLRESINTEIGTHKVIDCSFRRLQKVFDVNFLANDGHHLDEIRGKGEDLGWDFTDFE